MNRVSRPLSCLLLIATLLGSAAAVAEPRGRTQGSAQDQGQGQGQGSSPTSGPSPRSDSALPDSVRRVEQNGGEVLRAEPMQRDGREVYRIKVLTSDGRVRVMQDDPQERQAPNPRPERRQSGSSQGRTDGQNGGNPPQD